MKHLEFRNKVKELRVAQKHYWRLKKGDPAKDVAKRKMREVEAVVRAEIKKVMAYRPEGKSPSSDEERFFLDVADMMERQLIWMKNQSYTSEESSRKKERLVDEWIRMFEERERKTRQEEEGKRQLKLF